MIKSSIVILTIAAASYWFWSMKPEASRFAQAYCEEPCKTILWVETIVSKSAWLRLLRQEQSFSATSLGEFPSYNECAFGRARQIVALKEQEGKKARSITIEEAHRLVSPGKEGSTSVIVDDGSGKVITHTFFCGYQRLVPAEPDIPGLLPY